MKGNYPTYNDLTVWAAGTFAGGNDIDWKVEILRYADPGAAKELTFPGRQPLVIEWEDWVPEKAVRGSVATLKIWSKSDREWVDLYTANAGMCVADIYRRTVGGDWELFWRGRLDTEFYEEPYVRNDNYEVTLTFTDFGFMNRTDYEHPDADNGTELMSGLVFRALRVCGLQDYDEDGTAPGTRLMVSGRIMPRDAQFPEDTYDLVEPGTMLYRTDNFFDEDNKPNTMREAVEAILLPFGLHMEQRGGEIWIYDLNALHDEGKRSEVCWWGTSRTLGTAETYQDMTVSYSLYGKSEVMEGELDTEKEDGWNVFHVYRNALPDMEKRDQYMAIQDAALYDSFRLWKYSGTELPEGIESISNGSLWRIEPVMGDVDEHYYISPADSDYLYPTVTGGSVPPGDGSNITDWVGVIVPDDYAPREIFRTKGFFLPKCYHGNYRLRVSMEMLLDPRYNPCTRGEYDDAYFIHNDSTFWNIWKKNVWQVFIPVSIELHDADGNVTSRWISGGMTVDNTSGRIDYQKYTGGWSSESLSSRDWKECWLCYRPASIAEGGDENGSCVSGWSVNAPCMGRILGPAEKSELMDLQGDGMLIDYPQDGGYLVVRVLGGVWAWQGNRLELGFTKFPEMSRPVYHALECMQWWGYGMPQVEIVDSLTLEAPDIPDAEYEGWLNRDSSEHLELETMCGSLEEYVPTARGIVLSRNGGPVATIRRAGVTDAAERLLMGTFYSQYSQRRTTITGEATARVDSGDPGMIYTEEAMPEAVFVASAERMDCGTGFSEITLTRFYPEEWEATIFK